MKTKKFTLIELIAVIIILGIIAVTAIPKYYDLKEKAEAAVAEGVLASAQSALAMNWAAFLAGEVTAAEVVTDDAGLRAALEDLSTDEWGAAGALTWTTDGGTTYTISLSTTTSTYGTKTKQKATLTTT